MDSITSHFGLFVHFTQFLAPKIKIFEKKTKTKTPGYIIILHLHPKNHNHLMYSSLKMMPTALQVMLGQFLPFYSIFGPKLKFSKNEKMPKKVLKILKITNILKIKIISNVLSQIEWTSFLPILGHFCSFTPFLAHKRCYDFTYS